MTDLWNSNTPAHFWRCELDLPEGQWWMAIQEAASILELPVVPGSLDILLTNTLGEAQFGPERWRLSPAKRLYYILKPLLPRTLTRFLKRIYQGSAREQFPLEWPIEDRYVRFQWEVMRQLLVATDEYSLSFKHFWPRGLRFALVLTHDIETSRGQAFARTVADLEEGFDFRSSFNFVPERYSLDQGLIQELRERGFEVGVHGLKHDGKLFSSHAEFVRRAERINWHLKELYAVGFRAPLMHRQPEWMQALDIEYDLSFFDTDPFEPMPGGVMSIWPFTVGRFVELPYTLVQDYTLTDVLGETNPRLWLTKLDFIERYWGMALINTHPDYLDDPTTWKVYVDFLDAVKEKGNYWNALPLDVARWWRTRERISIDDEQSSVVLGKAVLTDGEVVLH